MNSLPAGDLPCRECFAPRFVVRVEAAQDDSKRGREIRLTNSNRSDRRSIEVDHENHTEHFDELWPEPSFEEMVAGSKVIRQTLYGLQDGNGVDVSLIVENLRLSPE